MRCLPTVFVSWMLILIFSVPVFAQDGVPTYLKKYESEGLSPIGESVHHDGTQGFPPELQGRTQTETTLDYTVTGTALTPEALSALHNAALANEQVRQALGERFIHLNTGILEVPKDVAGEPPSSKTSLQFYSYTHNRAIDVHIRDNKVVAVVPRQKGYQPVESREEIALAAEIVGADQRYRTATAGLTVRGLVTAGPDDHRYLYLLFYQGQGTHLAVLSVTVDMTNKQVVMTKPDS